MEIKTFTVADLKAALIRQDFWLTQTLPITKHRAISYCRNPRADENDTVLLVAYRDGRVIGYLGILPDKLFLNDQDYKLGWLTSWWVDPAYFNSGVGAFLLFKALNAYDQYVGVSGSSKEARKALKASQKFMPINPLQGREIRLRYNATGYILRRFPAMNIFRDLIKIVDSTTDAIVHLRSLVWQRRSNPGRNLTFEYVSEIDEETGRFIKKYHQNDLTRKGPSDLSWIMNNPWILSAPLKDSVSKRYYFSSRAAMFSYLGVKVFENQSELIGFCLLKVRDDRMTVLFSYCENQHAASVFAAVFQQALAMDVRILSLFDEHLMTAFTELNCPCWSVKKNREDFRCRKRLTIFRCRTAVCRAVMGIWLSTRFRRVGVLE